MEKITREDRIKAIDIVLEMNRQSKVMFDMHRSRGRRMSSWVLMTTVEPIAAYIATGNIVIEEDPTWE